MEHKYRALRIISTIYKVLGAIAAVVTVLGGLGFCLVAALGGMSATQFGSNSGLVGGLLGGLFGGVFILLYGALIAVTLWAFGEGIDLLMALEENTRLTALLLQQPGSGGAPAPGSYYTPPTVPGQQ